MNQKTMPAIKAATTRPPTTPPAILPVFELLLDDGPDDEEGDMDEGALGATVDWLFLVEVGTMGTLPVTSGESVTGPSMRKMLIFVGKVTHRRQAVPPLNPSHRWPVGADEMRLSRRKDQEVTVMSIYAQYGTRVPAGTGSGKLRDKVEFISLRRRMTRSNLRSGICNRSAIEIPYGVASYTLICISMQGRLRLCQKE
jgi:hypothetical protein